MCKTWVYAVPHTQICGLQQDRKLSGGNPGGGEGGHEALPALPCPLFPLSDVPFRLRLLPRHMGSINHCCDLAERTGLTQHSRSAIKLYLWYWVWCSPILKYYSAFPSLDQLQPPVRREEHPVPISCGCSWHGGPGSAETGPWMGQRKHCRHVSSS